MRLLRHFFTLAGLCLGVDTFSGQTLGCGFLGAWLAVRVF